MTTQAGSEEQTSHWKISWLSDDISHAQQQHDAGKKLVAKMVAMPMTVFMITVKKPQIGQSAIVNMSHADSAAMTVAKIDCRHVTM